MLTISVQLVVDVQILCFENRWNIFELDALPEWLRGQTRNLMGSSRAGSNPAGIVFFILVLLKGMTNVVVNWNKCFESSLQGVLID